MILHLKRTIYGLVQSALSFWLIVLKAMQELSCDKSKADPCLYYKWTKNGLVIWVSWIDDLLCAGPKEEALKMKAGILNKFACDEQGKANKYIGNKIERGVGYIKLTQPVFVAKL